MSLLIHTIIGIGSNIDSEKNIQKALELLKSYFTLIAVTDLQKTKPIGIINQADFLNAAVLLLTSNNFDEVQNILKKIENQLGRDRTLPKYGPRVIDLDIIVWKRKIIDQDYFERDFLKSAVDKLLTLY